MVHSQKRVFCEEVLNAPPCGRGRHGRVGSHGACGCKDAEVRTATAFLQEHPSRAVEVGHGRRDGGHVAQNGLLILVQGDGLKLHLALGRRLRRGRNCDPILRGEVLDPLSAVPLFIRD